jgi:hypothetical protein
MADFADFREQDVLVLDAPNATHFALPPLTVNDPIQRAGWA